MKKLFLLIVIISFALCSVVSFAGYDPDYDNQMNQTPLQRDLSFDINSLDTGDAQNGPLSNKGVIEAKRSKTENGTTISLYMGEAMIAGATALVLGIFGLYFKYKLNKKLEK